MYWWIDGIMVEHQKCVISDSPMDEISHTRHGTGSPGQRFWSGWVGSVVCVSDLVFDLVLSLTCTFITALFLQSNTISAN